MNPKTFASVAVLALLIFAPCHAKADTVITFDDGISGQSISNFYASVGVLFSNVVWWDNRDIYGDQFAGSSGAFVVAGESSSAFPSADTALIATFSSPVTNATIVASDVGDAGARLEAYDQEIGGNMVAADEYFGGGIGVQTFATLTVTAPTIKRVIMFQPLRDGGDGVIWDTLTCAPSPVIAPTKLTMSLSGEITIQSYLLGASNRIEYVDSLYSTNWTTLTNFTLPASPYTIVDPDFAHSTHRFYRAVTLP